MIFLASSLYWPILLLACVAGVAMLLRVIFRALRGRGAAGWWWQLPLAGFLIVGPYLLDVVRERIGFGESVSSAPIPTTVLLKMMGPDNKWPYGIVFDRLHKAPARHAMWGWQLNELAGWCRACIAGGDNAMAMRGTQIAATLAGRGSDDAVAALGEALMHKDKSIATLACDVLESLGLRSGLARDAIARAIAESPHAEIRQRAERLRATLNAPGDAESR